MKPENITVGKTYRNRGAGTTVRTVLDIGPGNELCQKRPNVAIPPTTDLCVVYHQTSHRDRDIWALSLKSFAQWAGSEMV